MRKDNMIPIPVVIEETTGISRRGDTLIGGIPVARGVLPGKSGWYRIESEDGKRFTLEGRPAAFWPDGSAKWLHLCGTVDLEGGTSNIFSLMPADPPFEDAGLRVHPAGDALRVTGGMLDVVIRPDTANLVEAALAGETPRAVLKAPGLSAQLGFIDPERRQPRSFDFALTDDAVRTVVTDAERVVIRVGGIFRDENGEPVSELILFFEILRQHPELRIEPVWIYLGHPNQDLVERLTVSVHTALQSSPDTGYTFADERGAFADIVQRIRNDERGGDGPAWPLARQVQSGSSFYRTEKNTNLPDASWLKAVEGRRAQGWCNLDDGQSRVTAAMRYYWQEYPHSLSVDAEHGTLTFGLIPPETAPLDLRRYSPTLYGAAMYETGSGPYNVELHGPRGIAKSHELMIRFDPSQDTESAARALFFTRPCRPLATPQYLAGSGVLGRVSNPETAPVPAAEATIAAIVEYIRHERDYRGWYGLMDYGDIMSSFYSDLDRWAYDDGGYAWINTESMPDLGLWMSALRAGRADWLAMAIDMSRHNRDVDCYHRGQLKGLGSRHNVNHWGCADKEWRVSMPLTRRFHYYVTADPWTAEAIRETVAVYRSYEDRKTRLAPGLTAAVAGILTLWEMTADPELEKVLQNLAATYAGAIRDDGRFIALMHLNLVTGEGYSEGDAPHESTFFMNTFGGQHVLIELATLLEHRSLCETLVRHADYWVREQKAGTGVLGFLAFAARYSGDPRYRDAIRAVVDEIHVAEGIDPAKYAGHNTFAPVAIGGDTLLDTPRHPILPGMKRRNKVACHELGDTMHLVPYGLAALADD